MGRLPESTKYMADRQVDVELLQSVDAPSHGTVWLSVSSVSRTPKMVAGIQKMAQRYARLLLTEYGSQKFQPRIGGNILSSLGMGIVSNVGYLTHLVAAASALAVDAMRRDDARAEFGEIPDDEAIESAEILDVSLDFAARTAGARVRLTSRAGSEYVYVIPVDTGIGQ